MLAASTEGSLQPSHELALPGKRSFWLHWLVVFGTALAAVSLATAETFMVDCAGNGDYRTIQDGLDACDDGDTVLISPGVYKGDGNRDLVLRTRTAVIGVGGASATVIDCEYQGSAFLLDGGKLWNYFEGLTMTRGNSLEGAWPSVAGGAVYSHHTHSRFVDCVFSESYASATGGGVFAQGDGLVFERCVFSGNWTGGDSGRYTHAGAAFALSYGCSCHEQTEFRSCEFRDNNSGGGGGAVSLWLVYGTALFDNTLFINNLAHGLGGAIRFEDWNTGATSVVSGCTFIGNSPGAIYFADQTGSTGIVRNSTFASNESDTEGSSIHSRQDADPLVERCIMSYGLGSGPAATGGGTYMECCVFGNAGGDSLPAGNAGNMVAAPLYCGLTVLDLTLSDSSPCLPENNKWGVLIGAHAEGCDGVPVEHKSWGWLKSMFR